MSTSYATIHPITVIMVWMIRSFLFCFFLVGFSQWREEPGRRREKEVVPEEGAGSTNRAGASVVYLWNRAASTSTASEGSGSHSDTLGQV